MEKSIFFGLVRENNSSLCSLYLINDTNNPITLKRKEYGGFTTLDDDDFVMATPQNEEVSIIIEPHSYIHYETFSQYDIAGANQYVLTIDTIGGLKRYVFYMSGSVGFMGNLIPCLNKYGQSIRPSTVEDL